MNTSFKILELNVDGNTVVALTKNVAALLKLLTSSHSVEVEDERPATEDDTKDFNLEDLVSDKRHSILRQS